MRPAMSRLALMSGLLSAPAAADSVPFSCLILPGDDVASVVRGRPDLTISR